jgi:predicted DNA-binding transcriptional regulator AlpA
MSDRKSLVPRFLRQKDLEELGISASPKQTYNLQRDCGFPLGRKISPRVRGYSEDEVLAWLATRPTERNAPPPARSVGRPREAA